MQTLAPQELLDNPTLSFNTPEPTPEPTDVSMSVPVEQISSTNLASYKTDVPEITTTKTSETIDSIIAQANVAQNRLNEIKAEEQSPKSTAENFFMQASSENLAPQKEQIREDANIYAKQEITERLYNEMEGARLAHIDNMEALRQNPEGKLRGAVNAQLNRTQMDHDRQMAYKAIAYNSANGDYQRSAEIVNSRIADLEADKQARIDMWKQAWSFAQNDLTESEKVIANQNFSKEMAELDFARDKEMTQMQDALARDRDTINFNRSQSVKAQEQARADRLEAISQMETAEQQVALEEMLSAERQEFVSDLTGLATHPGLNSAVGPLGVNRWAIGDAFGNKDEFIGKVENVVKTLTLNTYAEAKEKGMTFGAMSAGEWKILGDSATAISDWRETDKNGNVVGYDISETGFKRELDNLTQFAQLDAILKGEDPKSVGTQVLVNPDTNVTEYWTLNSFGNPVKIK